MLVQGDILLARPSSADPNNNDVDVDAMLVECNRSSLPF